MYARRAAKVVALIASAMAAGCSSSSGDPSSEGGAACPAAAYDPKIDPADFSTTIDNEFYPLVAGTTYTFVDVDGNIGQTIVTDQTKTLLGVETVVVHDYATSAEGVLLEDTLDYFAQDKAGNVWYFGEDTAEYSNGVVVSTAGTWEAGVDGAQPGIVMPARPRVGIAYRQEYRPKVAMDTARVLQTDAVRTVPAGTFRRVVVTFDRNPLDPSKKERKWYAPGVGLVYANLHGGGHAQITKLLK
jgi:hypothetical protein